MTADHGPYTGTDANENFIATWTGNFAFKGDGKMVNVEEVTLNRGATNNSRAINFDATNTGDVQTWTLNENREYKINNEKI